MGKYSKVTARALELRALSFHMMSSGTPYKAKVKRAASAHPFQRQDLKEIYSHPGSSRSRVTDFIRAAASEETGCTVAAPEQLRRLKDSARNSNTTHRSGLWRR